MQCVIKVFVFLYMVFLYEVTNSMEVHNTKQGNLRDLMKRSSTIDRQNKLQLVETDYNDKLDELLNVMKREDEIQQELDILKHLQDMSVPINNRQKREDAGEFVKSNKRRRALRAGFWWSCPICDGTTKYVPSRPGCRCTKPQNETPINL